MARNVRRTSLSEIFDPNSKYIKDLAQVFEQQYGDELDIILRLSDKYGCSLMDINPSNLDKDDIKDYLRVRQR